MEEPELSLRLNHEQSGCPPGLGAVGAVVGAQLLDGPHVATSAALVGFRSGFGELFHGTQLKNLRGYVLLLLHRKPSVELKVYLPVLLLPRREKPASTPWYFRSTSVP